MSILRRAVLPWDPRASQTLHCCKFPRTIQAKVTVNALPIIGRSTHIGGPLVPLSPATATPTRSANDSLRLASSARKHSIEMRDPHEPEEAARTVLHEIYHLAQFHKWGDLDPRRRKLSLADLERADSLAELYARLTAKALRRRRARSRRTAGS